MQAEDYSPQGYSAIPPPPEAASLMRYVDFPVSLFTGQPAVTLPVYVVREGSLELPITLSYHGGGVKVGELAGRVGLGWTLNTGGCVTRTVLGFPDECPNNEKLEYGYARSSVPVGLLSLREKFPQVWQMRKSVIARQLVNYSLDAGYDQVFTASQCGALDEGRADMANDIFQFNCAGYSGTFVYNPDDSRMTLSTASPVTLSPAQLQGSHLPSSFTLRDDVLNQFTFAEREDTRLDFTYQRGGQSVADSLYYISTWHLTEVRNLAGDVIRFKYLPAKKAREIRGLSQTLVKSTNDGTADPGTLHSSVQTVIYREKLLDEIVTQSLRVKFTYDSSYDELVNISVFSQGDSVSPVESYQLGHSTLVLATENPITQQKIEKRSLRDLSRVGSDGEKITLYRFDYHVNDNINPHYLTSQDHWGFYNGSSATTLLSSRSDRSSNVKNAMNGVLTRISYATGGSTTFDWEGNSYSRCLYGKSTATSQPWGGLRIASITHSTGDATDEKICRRFKYVNSLKSGTSSGVVQETPYYLRNYYEFNDFDGNQQMHGIHAVENRVETSQGLYGTPVGGSHVEYPVVWERFDGEPGLWIKSEFTSMADYPDLADETYSNFLDGGSRLYTSQSHLRGNLVKKTYYTGDDKVYRAEDYVYNTVTGNSPVFTGCFMPIVRVNFNTAQGYQSDYAACRYQLLPFSKALTRKTVSEYSPVNEWTEPDDESEQLADDNAFKTQSQCAYFEQDQPENYWKRFLKQETRDNSDGTSTTIYYTYCQHDDGNGHSLPLNLKQTEVAVCEGRILWARRYEYANGKLARTFRGPTGMSCSPAFGLGKSMSAGDTLLNAINIPEYAYKYESGNLVEVDYNGVVLASYVWSYHGAHPVAEIKDVPYDEVKKKIPVQKWIDEWNLKETDLNALRDAFPGHDVTTIICHGLVGMASLTDSNGITTRFTYDNFNRLKGMQDADGIFLKMFRYSYKNP